MELLLKELADTVDFLGDLPEGDGDADLPPPKVLFKFFLNISPTTEIGSFYSTLRLVLVQGGSSCPTGSSPLSHKLSTSS